MKVFERQGNVIVATTPFILTCGCGSIVPDTKRLLRKANVDAVFVNSTVNSDARKYVKQIGLASRIPSVSKSKHALVYNPFTTQFIDLLNAPKTDQLVEKIKRVLEG